MTYFAGYENRLKYDSEHGSLALLAAAMRDGPAPPGHYYEETHKHLWFLPKYDILSIVSEYRKIVWFVLYNSFGESGSQAD